jgi:hypothetical protein
MKIDHDCPSDFETDFSTLIPPDTALHIRDAWLNDNVLAMTVKTLSFNHGRECCSSPRYHRECCNSPRYR